MTPEPRRPCSFCAGWHIGGLAACAEYAESHATPDRADGEWPRIVASGGAVAWGKNYDPPQGAGWITPSGEFIPYTPRSVRDAGKEATR